MLRDSCNTLFLKFFPLPRFFVAPSFGLDISDESLKFVELIPTKTGIRLGKYGERAIPAGVIVSGRIKDSKKMKEILTSLRKSVGAQYVRVSLPTEQVHSFPLRLKKRGLKNVREGIELVLEEYTSTAVKDAIFDYDLIQEHAYSLDVQVAATPKDIVEEHLRAFKRSELKVRSLEPEAQAISRAVIEAGDLNTYMIVDFGKKRTGVFIVSRGIVMSSSTLNLGGARLAEAIKERFNITLEEAERMKQESGLKRNMNNKEVFSLVTDTISILRDEIAQQYLNWQTHKDEKGHTNSPIKKIIFCGEDSNLTGLADYISVSIKTHVEIANVWKNVASIEQYIPDMSFKQSLAFATAIGLALGDYRS